jgi:hypothetical protein
MDRVTKNDLKIFINDNIQLFHERRVESLKSLKLSDILHRKNPYLYKAKNILTAQELTKSFLDAHLSSQEEGIFGGFLEELAIFVCKKTYKGKKSSAEGIDLEFTNDKIEYIVTIKSGPNWGNSQQISKMKINFNKAKRIRRTNAKATLIVSVNGCCYGIDDNPDKGDYIKLCGQRFWEFISCDSDFYQKIIEPLGYRAKEKNESFNQEYSKVINIFTS